MVEVKLKVLIADDEQLARQRMFDLLKRFGDIEVVGEARNGEEVIQRCKASHVDLVFLDIQMPGLTGLDIADILNEQGIKFIFVSAYGEHALEAFSLQALDYLTKPVRPSRLEQALDRVRKQFVQSEMQKPRLKNKIAIPLGKKTSLIDCSAIVYATVFEGSMELLTTEKSYYLAWTLKNLEDVLENQQDFFKINRQTIINLNYLHSVEYGTGTLTMRNGKNLDLSRASAKKLRELL